MTPRKWVLAGAGGLVVVYAVVVLAFVATTPDIRLRCLMDDGTPRTADTPGIEIRDAPGVQFWGTQPEAGDRLMRIRETEIHTFMDFTRALNSLRNASIDPGGKLYAKSDPKEYEQQMVPPLVEDADGQRFVRVELLEQDSGQVESVWLHVQPLPLGEVLLSLAWLVLQLGILAVAALAYWNRPYERPSQLFFAMCIVTLGALIGSNHWWVIAGSLWLTVPCVVCAMLLPPIFLHFFQVFPRPNRLVAVHPWVAYILMYAIPVVSIACLLGLLVACHWFSASVDGQPPLDQIRQLLRAIRQVVYGYMGVGAAYFVATLVSLRLSYARTRNPMEHEQLKLLWRAGVASAFFLGIVLLLALFRRVDFALGAARVPLFLASLSLTIAYTLGIIRYKLMLIDQIVSKGVYYYLASCGLTVVFSLAVAMSMLVPQYLNISLSQQQALTIAAVLMLFVILLLWLRDRFQQIIDRQFFREKYQLDKALERVNRAVGHFVDPDSLAGMMVGSCRDVLGVEWAALYLRTSPDGPFQLVAAENADHAPLQVAPENELLSALSEGGSLQRVTPGTRSEMTPVQAQLHQWGVNLVHPLKVGLDVAGLVMLGGKKSAGAFTAEDVTFLIALSQMTSVALHSAKVDQDIARLNEDLRLKVDKLSSQRRQIAALQAELANTQNESVAAPRPSSEIKGFQRGPIKGCSPAVESVLATARKVATSESTVLIRGESGTGKELLAEVLHVNSRRKSRPMISVHCAALAPTLLESELFGHVKGAYTGAYRDKMGRFEAASGGTLFLDEIGDISLETQVKLLRVLQERCFEPVGGTRTIHVDVRLIAATHQNLEELITQGRFREDLYYRLNVISIHLPPLRERTEDIFELSLHFLNRFAKQIGKPMIEIDDQALAALERYSWPGNVRELENVIERAVVLADGESITLRELPSEFVQSTAPPALRGAGNSKVVHSAFGHNGADTLAAAAGRATQSDPTSERELLKAILRRCGGNKAEAARSLGMPRSTYYSKLKKYAIE